MKRLNPATNKPFIRGHIRADGYIFNAYTTILKRNGMFKEVWLKPDVFQKIKNSDLSKKNRAYKRKTSKYPKGSTWYFKRDLMARLAYKQAMEYLLENPGATPSDLEPIVDIAPYVLKIIYPDTGNLDFKEIFKDGEKEVAFQNELKRLQKLHKKTFKRKSKLEELGISTNPFA